MQIDHRVIFIDIIHRAGHLKKQANTGAVTYVSRFVRVKAPCHNDMEGLVHIIIRRIAEYLERRGLIQRDIDNSYLN